MIAKWIHVIGLFCSVVALFVSIGKVCDDCVIRAFCASQSSDRLSHAMKMCVNYAWNRELF